MSRPASLWWKEIRALLPLWIGGFLTAGVASLTRMSPSADPGLAGFHAVHELSLVACVALMIGLGAQSIGHEYSHRTVGVMLMIPVGRRQLLLTKFTVLAGMVLPLATCVWLLEVFVDLPSLPWWSAGAALCLAPVLTMLCRNALAGAVFSAAIPGMLFTAASIVIATFSGLAEAERTALDALFRLMVPLLAAGAVLGWSMFMRLESIDGGTTEVRLPWSRRTPRGVRPGHPIWQLVKKELRLQQMAFAMTALYVAVSAAVLFWGASVDAGGSLTGPFRVASAVYWLGLPVLVGALATAEERHLGTIAWQLQLPMPARVQWAVKIGTVFGLAILLAVVTPAVLTEILWPAERRSVVIALVLATVTTAMSIYISSLCTSGVRAAMASLAVIPLSFWLVTMVAITIRRPRPAAAFWTGRESAWLVLVVLLVVALVAVAFVNHKPDAPPSRRIWRQSLAIAALLATVIVGLEIAPF